MTFADVLRSSTAQMNDIADLLEDLLVTYDQKQSSTMRTTSSASYAVASNTDIAVTTEEGDVILYLAHFQYSHSIAGQGISFIARMDTVNIAGPSASVTHDSSVDGNRLTVGFHSVLAPASPGVHSFDTIFAVAAGTGYLKESVVTALVFQNT